MRAVVAGVEQCPEFAAVERPAARQAGAWGVLHGGDLAVILDREKPEMSSDDGKLRRRHERIAVVAFRR